MNSVTKTGLLTERDDLFKNKLREFDQATRNATVLKVGVVALGVLTFPLFLFTLPLCMFLYSKVEAAEKRKWDDVLRATHADLNRGEESGPSIIRVNGRTFSKKIPNSNTAEKVKLALEVAGLNERETYIALSRTSQRIHATASQEQQAYAQLVGNTAYLEKTMKVENDPTQNYEIVVTPNQKSISSSVALEVVAVDSYNSSHKESVRLQTVESTVNLATGELTTKAATHNTRNLLMLHPELKQKVDRFDENSEALFGDLYALINTNVLRNGKIFINDQEYSLKNFEEQHKTKYKPAMAHGDIQALTFGKEIHAVLKQKGLKEKDIFILMSLCLTEAYSPLSVHHALDQADRQAKLPASHLATNEPKYSQQYFITIEKGSAVLRTSAVYTRSVRFPDPRDVREIILPKKREILNQEMASITYNVSTQEAIESYEPFTDVQIAGEPDPSVTYLGMMNDDLVEDSDVSYSSNKPSRNSTEESDLLSMQSDDSL